MLNRSQTTKAASIAHFIAKVTRMLLTVPTVTNVTENCEERMSVLQRSPGISPIFVEGAIVKERRLPFHTQVMR
jgi:hypothetical protein